MSSFNLQRVRAAPNWDGPVALLFHAPLVNKIRNIVKVKLKVWASNASVVFSPNDKIPAQIGIAERPPGFVQGITVLIQCSAEPLLHVFVGSCCSHNMTSK